MGLEAEKAVYPGVIALGLQQRQRQEFSLGLAHFAGLVREMMHMEPVIAPFMPQIGLALGDFIGVVGENIVHAAAVDIHVFAQMLHTDAGAFNMPTGVSHSPGTLPFQGLVLKLGFGKPQHKVVAVFLVGILLHILTDPHQKLFLALGGEDIVVFEFGCIEIHIATRQIGIAFFQQLFHHMDELRNAVCGGLHHVRRLDIQLCAVAEKSVRVKLCDLHHGLVLPLRALEHLILPGIRIGGQMPHICDIHNALHVIPHVAQGLLQHILLDIAAQIADMGKMVDCGAAGVHGHLPVLIGNKSLHLPVQSVVKL